MYRNNGPPRNDVMIPTGMTNENAFCPTVLDNRRISAPTSMEPGMRNL